MSIRFGGSGPDTLPATNGWDLLAGLGGNDTLDGLDGRDAVFGGSGNDSVFGGAGDDLVSGGDGNDRVVGDARPGGPNPVEVGGTPGRNLLLGGRGDDLVQGGYGEDTAFGGSGNDTIIGWGYGPPSPSGAEGWEALDDADLLCGGAGRDSIRGGGGKDSIYGGSGDDTLQGGYDLDVLTGGRGADRFLFGREGIAGFTLDSGIGPGNRDVVTDFRHADDDVLDLSGYRSGFLPRDTPPPVFIGNEAFRVSPEDGNRMQVRYEVEGDRTIVQIYTQFNLPPPEYPQPVPGVTVEIELLGVRGLTADDVFLG
ncbi:calcium-binding protein [Belnapia rosea]|uniref:calcium-binding protein n=1 Tax=Belnapia rosea TaxID=938405 RepID=UPI00088E412D|nr:calcium-binding protein [Belnapia rosea]SDB16370.1 Hemolysin-type calcium-binding repeat-containing protein [Belnapia rosea]